MKSVGHYAICLLFFLVTVAGHAQVLAGFENFGLKPGQYLNNAAPGAIFSSGSIELPNFYDPEFNYWSGWAISADTNTTMPGFLNQYSAIAGGGALGTTSYAVGYIYDPTVIRLAPNAIGKPMIGMYVANSTYAYLSMRDGDGFAKKFGGETGNDPDFLLLTIKKYAGGAVHDDSITLYLADYRFPQKEKDYILHDWTYVDLTVLGGVDSLVLKLTSSDIGIFGMNTPAYMCIDQVSTDNLLSSSLAGRQQISMMVGPNPARDVVYMEFPVRGQLTAVRADGVVAWTGQVDEGHQQLHVAEWPRGLYILTFNDYPVGKVVLE